MSDYPYNKHTHGIWVRDLKMNLVKKDFPQAINDMKVRLAKMATKCEMDYHDLALEAIAHGLEHMEEKYKKLTGEVEEGLDEEHKRLIALFDMRVVIAQRKRLLEDLMPIYEDLGTEGFEDWCETNGFDHQEFYRLRREEIKSLSWAKQCQTWIDDQLRDEMEPVPKREFLDKAWKAGLIKNKKSEEAFYKHVQRMGYAGNPYGFVFAK